MYFQNAVWLPSCTGLSANKLREGLSRPTSTHEVESSKLAGPVIYIFRQIQVLKYETLKSGEKMKRCYVLFPTCGSRGFPPTHVWEMCRSQRPQQPDTQLSVFSSLHLHRTYVVHRKRHACHVIISLAFPHLHNSRILRVTEPTRSRLRHYLTTPPSPVMNFAVPLA